MKPYETGICVCGKKKKNHFHGYVPSITPYLFCDHVSRREANDYRTFKDSGLAQLEANAPELLEALEFAREFHMLDDPDGEPFASINKAINEALKR